ncbi:MAG: hypothetical protein ACETVW_05530 [Dehalococcoidia bacterium]
MRQNSSHWEAGRCLQMMRETVELSEFGFRIQGIAAHVLLRLGAQVLEVNSQGHPDIVAATERGSIRIEVEADIRGSRPRLLTKEDLESIAPRRTTDKGYFALALCGPYPQWLLVEYSRLSRRYDTPASPAILRALSDEEASEQWTSEFIKLLLTHCQHLPAYSFDLLARRALEGRPL